MTESLPAESLSTAPVSPKAAPLPPLPASDPFTPAQWKTLLAIADACVPAIKPISQANTQTELAVSDQEYAAAVAKLKALTPQDDPDAGNNAKEYLAVSATSNPAFKEELHRIFALYMPHDTKTKIGMVLNILNTRAGSYALTGYVTPISEQPAHICESILRSWATSRLGPLRQLHGQLTILTKQTFVKLTPSLRRILGFPRVSIGMRTGKGYDYEFIQIPPGEEAEIIETDVVIIGSGCGGGVCAKNLAEAGQRVLVVEKAYHYTPDHFPMSEATGMHHLFMNGALMSADDGSISVIAGQAFGGGGVINWSASLLTQGYVRREWAARGLPFFTSAAFQDSLDRVCGRMGVSADHIKQNRTNEILMEGARKLGYSHKVVPQNTGGSQHHCGHCSFGCGSCEKQGPSVSYLPDAARAGAKFLEGFHAEKIVFSNQGGKQVATGVRGTWVARDTNGGVAGEPLATRKLIIRAKRVIVSAGTMQSPLLLLRSGLNNAQIGRNLHLHPVMFLGAIHEEEVKPWEGAILTSVVGEYENLDGAGHGVKLEATNMIPSSWLVWLNWLGGLQYKLEAARLKHMVGYISICRDRDTGRVYPDPVDGRARVQYSVSKFDKKHIVEGLVALAQIQYVHNASEIFTVVPGMPPFIRDPASPAGDGINDARFQAWLEEIRTRGFPAPESMFLSAHQMGTCRMSALARDGVVDPKGRVWGVEGLFVADASVFPSASGVNPMVTNMAIADYISRGIAKGLEGSARL
ncbi:long-chain fatty alcohol dehydrogenase [Dothidotthia symphoricarpi CBS 119687]|uniref:Long-chain-alcohol oxidase n=1 Tax=Dothidotthia symphoricarpi CBS 119687 TaxID=1392245 RepID=A0A6A6A0L7_9PLEO|nr:long-chain fatty alcohol dehydrogenase [Dothidotthia symphoricarpi CBS 119687]KAF2124694.1 long-chain fatty alcohol dehydrogenase [Dothidotthia symphoricarpi CBS 119687]